MPKAINNLNVSHRELDKSNETHVSDRIIVVIGTNEALMHTCILEVIQEVEKATEKDHMHLCNYMFMECGELGNLVSQSRF